MQNWFGQRYPIEHLYNNNLSALSLYYNLIPQLYLTNPLRYYIKVLV